jgi:hypothetical protein
MALRADCPCCSAAGAPQTGARLSLHGVVFDILVSALPGPAMPGPGHQIASPGTP